MISVIIPTYNYGHFIEDAIQSIISQTYTDWEIIIIDDGSTDNTADIVKKFTEKKSNIKYFYQDNSGPSVARNKGIMCSNGELIQFLDADDLIECEKFSTQVKIFNNNPKVDIVYSSVRYFDKDAFNFSERLFSYWGKNKEWMPKLSGKGNEIISEAFKANFSHLSSIMFKRNLINNIGFFDEDLRIAEDYNYLLRCVINGAYFYYFDLPNTYSLVRWHNNNTSKNVNMMKLGEKNMRVKMSNLLTLSPEAHKSNSRAIKSLEYQLGNSWKKHLLSGGKFDFFKKIINNSDLEKILLKLFYN